MTSGDWIALAALLVAISVAIAQYRLQRNIAREQHRLQERLAAIEEEKRDEELATRARALVVCEKRKEPTAAGRLAIWIIFRNEGKAPARDVWFERDQLSSLITGDQQNRYPRLMPGQEWKILADPTMGLPDRIQFRYGWTDDAGQHEEGMVYSVYT